MKLPYNRKTKTITGFLKISEKREEELDYLLWKMWEKDLNGAKINTAMILEKLVEIADTPAELAYVMWLGVQRWADLKECKEALGELLTKTKKG